MKCVIELARSELAEVVGGNATVFSEVHVAPVGVSSVLVEIGDQSAAVAVSGAATALSPNLTATSSSVAMVAST